MPTTEELGGESSASGEEDCEEGCAPDGPGGHAGERVSSAKEVAEHNDDDDDQDMFITPAPSWQTSRSAFEHTRKATTSQASSKKEERVQERGRDRKEVGQREPRQRVRTP